MNRHYSHISKDHLGNIRSVVKANADGTATELQYTHYYPFGGIIADISSNSRVEDRLFNGKPYTKSYIDYADLLAGGTLRLIMGPSPSKWGTAKKDRP